MPMPMGPCKSVRKVKEQATEYSISYAAHGYLPQVTCYVKTGTRSSSLPWHLELCKRYLVLMNSEQSHG